MTRFDYDLFTIGAGSGGVRASRMAGQFGARVAIAENYRIGGTCVIRGCIPKKLLAYAAHYAEDLEDARGFGWTIEGAAFSWPALIENKNREIARLSGVYADALAKAGVAAIEGTAKLLDAHTVAIGERRVTAQNILIATGGWPGKPAIPGIEHAITSNEAFELPMLPRRVLIVGGGYVAVEFAGIFNGLGAEVTLSYRGEQILRGFDDDVRRHLHDEMGKKGVRILLASEVSRIARRADGALEAAVSGLPGNTLACDAVMVATGRTPNTARLGLAEAGVRLDDAGGVVVDRFCRSSVANIYAVGDVTHRIALTPVAIREGAAVATTLFGGRETPVDHDDVPSAVFSQPPVGTVGLSESKAAAKLGKVDIYRTSFRPLRHTLSGRDERTLAKLVVDAASERVVGAHMVGADAPEIIQGIAIAVKAGLTKAQFDATVGIHPTAAEEFVTLREKPTAEGSKTSAPAAPKARTLQICLGGYGPSTTTHSRALKMIGDALAAQFGKGVDIKYVWNVMDFGYKADEVLWMAERGLLTVAYQSTSYLTERVPELEFVDLPFLFETLQQARAAMDGKLGAYLSRKIEERIPGYRMLGYFENGYRHISNRLRPVHTPADLKGLRIRSLPSLMHSRTYELLGAIPMIMDLKPAIAAITAGEVDAQENPLANTVDYRVHQVHRYHTLTGHSYLSRGIYCNRAAYESWPSELQAAMTQAVRAAILAQRELAVREEQVARKAIEESGGEIVELTPQARAAFVRAVKPLHDEARTRFGDMFALLD